MDINKFIEARPYLYHLTSALNAPNIIAERKLYSANSLIDICQDENLAKIKRRRRPEHQILQFGDKSFSLRDQRPISEKALAKCLTNNWSVADFLYHLNDRVFMWPTIDRLWKHFNRYESEEPIIFRFSTREIIEANPQVKFCRLNSGATRANSYLGEKPPERGIESFVPAADFHYSVGAVAEVTFENHCTISGSFGIGGRPDGDFKIMTY